MPGEIDNVLVTGGAGFIGSHVTNQLIDKGYEVTILDNLDRQVHTNPQAIPSYINNVKSAVIRDVRDREVLRSLLLNTDAVVHLASAVGVGQSMYQIEKYVDANTRATALLLDQIANENHHIRKVVVASSMSIYGEGKYLCEKCNAERYPTLDEINSRTEKNWEHSCKECGHNLVPMPTDEETPLRPTSIYAMSKRHQEEMCLLIGKTYGVPTVALRFFNVYGPRQSLSNPYTGAAAIFLSRILNGKPPYIFEDGNQRRDFVYVDDLARANVLALEKSNCDYQAINIGTGKHLSILQLALVLGELCNSKVKPVVTNSLRKGDIRHCYADTRKAREMLGFVAETEIREGLRRLSVWAIQNTDLAVDKFEYVLQELRNKGLTSS